MANQYKAWTSEEDEVIVSNYGKKTYSDIHRLLSSRSYEAIKIRANRLKVAHRDNEWTESEVNTLIKEYSRNPRITELLPNRKWENIKKKACKLGLRIKYGTYKFDHNFFKVWNEKSAYIAGFIAADGYLNFGANRVEICVNRKDRDLLVAISNAISYEGPIYDKQNVDAVRLQICSQELLSDLFSILGVRNNKSLEIQSADVPDSLVHHFIRGYIDGDGCIKTGRCVLSILGTQKFLEWINSKFNSHIGIEVKSPKRKGHENVFYVEYSGDRARAICKWIYPDDKTIFLERKYNKYVHTWPEHNVKCHAPKQGEDIVGTIRNDGALNA